VTRRIGHVFNGLALGLVGIIVMLTWWQLLKGPELRERQSNAQSAWYEQRIDRGRIYAADGTTILAKSKPVATKNGDVVYRREYPQGIFTAHAVGYDTSGRSRTGLERRYNDVLTGSNRGLGSVLDKAQGKDTVRGDSLKTTLDPGAQRAAIKGLQGKTGAVVALDPRSGKVLAMASSPTFDPGSVEDEFESISSNSGAPLLNRVTQARYAPGSTFKTVTAAAALENGLATPTTTYPGGCKTDSESGGPPIYNFGRSCVGRHDLTQALTQSINITFANLGDEIGKSSLTDQMSKFGFFSTPPLDDLPASERATSGLYDGNTPLAEDDPLDVARIAIGQERLGVTPLQMAMVSGAIANDGILMKPYLVDSVVSPTGRVRSKTSPKQVKRAMNRSTAKDLQEMMANVVREGTGTAAALDGVEVGGKSGTADTPDGNQVWFIAFAPVDNPVAAVAVTIEGLPSGATGGVYAAPVARDVLNELTKRK
jgi:peptidoglycan glycosyltransferase